MTDLQIVLIMAAASAVFAGYLVLCERVRAMNALEVARRARGGRSCSSTCSGPSCGPRTSER